MIPRFYSDVFALLYNIKIVMRNTIMLLIIVLAMCFQIVRAQVPSTTAWLRADSADLNAPVWVDVSGNGFHAEPSAGTLPAEFSLMNFNKCFEFSNGEYYTPLTPNWIIHMRDSNGQYIYNNCALIPFDGNATASDMNRIFPSSLESFNFEGKLRDQPGTYFK